MTTRHDTCLHIPVPPPSRCSSCGCEAAPHVLLFGSILPIPSCRCRPAFGDGGLQSILVGMPGFEPGISPSLTGRDACFATFRKPKNRLLFFALQTSWLHDNTFRCQCKLIGVSPETKPFFNCTPSRRHRKPRGLHRPRGFRSSLCVSTVTS